MGMFHELGVTLSDLTAKSRKWGDCIIYQGSNRGKPMGHTVLCDGVIHGTYQAQKIALCLEYPGLDYHRFKALNKCGNKRCINHDHWDAVWVDEPQGNVRPETLETNTRLKQVRQRAKPLAGHIRQKEHVHKKRSGAKQHTRAKVWEMTCFYCLKHIPNLGSGMLSRLKIKMRKEGYRERKEGSSEVSLWYCPRCVEHLGLKHDDTCWRDDKAHYYGEDE